MVGAEFRPWLGPNPERGWASFLHRGGANFLKPLGVPNDLERSWFSPI